MNVRIVEVSPRDGLQNEPAPIGTSAKVALVRALAGAGLTEVEATSFVSPRWVPQLADAEALWPQLPEGPRYSALAPNLPGLDRALAVGVERVAMLTAASESFCKKNLNCSVNAALDRCAQVAETFRAARPGGWLRAYISTAFECPFEGRVLPEAVVRVASVLGDLGVDEISIGDTVGAATPREVRELVRALPPGPYAWHFHDTRGTALANVATCLELGFSVFDASAGGLGGCPYAPGAGGNLATEDLVYFLEREGFATGVDLRALAQATVPVWAFLGRSPASRVQRAVLAQAESR